MLKKLGRYLSGSSSNVGKDNPTQVPLSSHSPCANKANSTAANSTNSTAGNSSHIVKSDLLVRGNNIVKIAANGQQVSPLCIAIIATTSKLFGIPTDF